MHHPLLLCATSVALLSLGAVAPVLAQRGDFVVAGGLTLPVQDRGAGFGPHARLEYHVWQGPRTFNLVLDGFVQRRFAREVLNDLIGDEIFRGRLSEWQYGLSATGQVTIGAGASAAPYLLGGVTYWRSDRTATATVTCLPGSGPGCVPDRTTISAGGGKFDAVLGAGVVFSGRYRLEARVLGGSGYNIPITFGIAF